MARFYDFHVLDKESKSFSLKSLEGKVVLIVNTAPKCGLRGQYADLEYLYESYKDRGFVILDFPSNQFLSQAPGSIEDIDTFCSTHYGTTFPRMAKVDVNGLAADPLFKWLKEEASEDQGRPGFLMRLVMRLFNKTSSKTPSDIQWNFTKFLINSRGEVVARYAPTVSPRKLERAIEKLLQH